MKILADMTSVAELTLEEAFPNTLTDTSCVYIDKGREMWVATEMCAQYIESVVDAIVVQNKENKPVGIVGGYDILDCIRKHPTRDFQYECKVDEIMFENISHVKKQTKIGDLLESWKISRRAFSVISNESGEYSPISARKMLEIGKKCNTDITVSSLPGKKIITFHHDDSLGDVLELMFENKTRKLVLENSNQFISDRMIVGEISKILKFHKDIEQLLDIPINQFKFESVKEIKEDLTFNRLCSVMDKMDHPFIIYKDNIISPWDICLALSSENIQAPNGVKSKTCPHCGKNID
jgi:predicted transcriptional regulator